jgi:branched-chain amino acid transport system substrate-binding protein
VLSAALVAVLALVTAACVGGDSGEPSDTVSAALDPLGVITIDPGAPLLIAIPSTGAHSESSIGEDAVRGVRLALDFLDGKLDGEPGQLLGHAVELVEIPGGCEPGEAAPIPNELGDVIVGVIGPLCARAMAREPGTSLTEAGIVMISPSATAAELTRTADTTDTFFRTAYNDRLEGRLVADFGLDELGVSRAAIVYVEDGTSGAAASFRSRFEDGGGVVVISGTLSGRSDDIDRLLRAIALGQPEVVYLVAGGSVCADTAIRASTLPGLQGIPIVTSAGCFGPAILSATESSSESLFVAGPDLGRFQEGDFYRMQFLPAYQEQFGTAPVGPFHTQAYDATLILLDAIDRIATQVEGGTLEVGRTALRDAVQETSEVIGLSGTISCTESGDCAPETTIAIYRVPDLPLAGGSPDAEPVFTETISLADLES